MSGYMPTGIEDRTGQKKRVFSVSELAKLIKYTLEEAFPLVWVEGELSNFKLHSSGHMYFSLKDESSVITCAFFARANRALKFRPADGMKVICSGRISFYTQRGQCQLYVDGMEPRGKGELYVAFEQLKAKLQEEGLFDPSRKKEIPYLPKRIGVVTSPTGAAIRDILNVVKRRFRNIEVILNPVRVQGAGAAGEIAAAIGEFNTYNRAVRKENAVSVLIVGRGGGSMEDLWAFNEEAVARAVFASEIPVISAVGHQVDFTISDFVADKRAPTPSAAAELVIPRKEELKGVIDDLKRRLDTYIIDRIQLLRGEVRALAESYILKQPINVVENYQQHVDDMARAAEIHINHFLEVRTAASNGLSGKLEMLSPFKVLSRGYSITTDAKTGRVLKDAAGVKEGDKVKTRLDKGMFVSEVKE